MSIRPIIRNHKARSAASTAVAAGVAGGPRATVAGAAVEAREAVEERVAEDWAVKGEVRREERLGKSASGMAGLAGMRS